MTSKPIHPILVQLRELRHARRISLETFQARHGIPAVVLGSYERGDRLPSVQRLTDVLACFGYELRAVPYGAVLTTDPAKLGDSVLTPEQIAGVLRRIARQVETAEDDPVLTDVLARIGTQRTGEEA